MPLSWPLLGPASSLSLAARRSRANPDPQHWAYHSEVLYLTFLGSPCYAPALPSCKEDEYPVGSECCPKCGPGFHVRQACGEQTGTVCEPCSPGTYIAHFNGLSKCLQCQMCDPAMGLRTSRNCSTTANALCGCSPGHFCIIQDGDHCAACRAYATSSPGQRVQKGAKSRRSNCPALAWHLAGQPPQHCRMWTQRDSWTHEIPTTQGPGQPEPPPQASPLILPTAGLALPARPPITRRAPRSRSSQTNSP
nr:tumor necrosis factor receptor superfamily member 14 isoform X4 [Macaca fascicularis]